MGFFTQNLTKTTFCTLLVTELCLTTMVVMGEVYKVGDSAGWTANSNSNYVIWASSKTFRVKDVILFEYDTNNDNVIQVDHSAFRSCNTSAPKTMFHSGNDSFTIKAPGHYYFTSNVSGHCQAGQKLDVRVLKTPPPVASPPPSSTAAPSPSPFNVVVESKGLAPSPSEGSAATTHEPMWLLMSTIGVALSGLVVLVHGIMPSILIL